MPERQRYYDPLIQEDQKASPIRGFQVDIGGVYVLLDDVVTALRQYAQSLDDPNAGALVHDLANWLGLGGESPALVPLETGHLETPMGHNGEVPVDESPAGAEPDDVTPDVERIEIFPDDYTAPKPKWFARSIDTSGFIMKTTGGSFDRDWVIKNAGERWPGIPIHELRSAGEDSKWIEDSTRGVFPSKGPPVRRLWAGAKR